MLIIPFLHNWKLIRSLRKGMLYMEMNKKQKEIVMGKNCISKALTLWCDNHTSVVWTSVSSLVLGHLQIVTQDLISRLTDLT